MSKGIVGKQLALPSLCRSTCGKANLRQSKLLCLRGSSLLPRRLAEERLEFAAVDPAVVVRVDLRQPRQPGCALQLVLGQAAVRVLVEGVEVGRTAAGTALGVEDQLGK